MKVSISDYKKGRKVKVKVSSSDTYALDVTLAIIIHPALVRFKKDRKKFTGVPMEFFRPSDPMTPMGHYTDEAHKNANQRFEYYLDKMIWAFEEAKNGYDEEAFYTMENGKLKYFDRKAFEQYHADIQEGIDLFAKYYKNLWW